MQSERRQFLKGTAVIAGSVFTFLQEIQGHSIKSLLIEAEEKGEPLLFDTAEVMTLAAIASQIVPTTDQPGAAEVGTVIYLNSQARKSTQTAKLYRNGVAELEKNANTKFGKPFHRAAVDDQTQLLREIEKGEFFVTVRRHTIEAYYTSPVGIYVVSGYRGNNNHGLCSPGEGFQDIDQRPKQ